MTTVSKSLAQRLEARSLLAPNGCILWTGHLNRRHAGYGHISVKRKKLLVHRIAWELVNGPIPEGMRILHRCDVPRCINPNHLRLGTQVDNIADMVAKERVSHASRNAGCANPSNKLSEQEVLEIFNDGGLYHTIAERFGVSASMVCAIKRRRKWTHVTKATHDGDRF